jgi:hypothetical protein
MARVVELLEKQTQHVLCACGDDAAEGVRAGMAGQSVPVVGEADDAGGVVQLLVEVAVGEGLGEVEGLQAREGGREGGGRGTAQRRRRHGVVRSGAVWWCGVGAATAAACRQVWQVLQVWQFWQAWQISRRPCSLCK